MMMYLLSVLSTMQELLASRAKLVSLASLALPESGSLIATDEGQPKSKQCVLTQKF